MDDTKSTKSKKEDAFVADFTAQKDHVIVQNDVRFEFVKGKKASETNTKKIPIKFIETLKVEGVLKGGN